VCFIVGEPLAQSIETMRRHDTLFNEETKSLHEWLVGHRHSLTTPNAGAGRRRNYEPVRR